MYLISFDNTKSLLRVIWAIMNNKPSKAMAILGIAKMSDVPQAITDKLFTPCQGRCPKECSQGIDEVTKENCTYCNGWGFVEARIDPWDYDIDAAKKLEKQKAVMLLTENGTCLSPCQWSPAGEISEDGFWIVWNEPAPEFFSEVQNPIAWMPVPRSKRAPNADYEIRKATS